MFSDVLSSFPMFSDCFPTVFRRCFPTDEFSSSWTKISMAGPQLFSGWYQMILDVFRYSQVFSDVFSWVATFMDNHPLCRHFFSGWYHMFSDFPEMFSDDDRCFWIFYWYYIDVLLKFSRCSQDVCRIFPGCFQDAPMCLVFFFLGHTQVYFSA